MTASFAHLDPGDPGIEHIRELWELTHDPGMGFDAKLDRVLETETAELELPYGFLTNIETEAEARTQTIEAARGSHELLQPGESGPLSESYCRHTIRADDGVFHVDDARAQGWTDDPAYQRYELGTYIGATVAVDGRPYGTLCFAASDARDSDISPGERLFVDLLATWVSHELYLRATIAELQRQAGQADELTSMVSHDLRSPLAVARGEAELLSHSVEASLETIDASHQRIAAIVDKLLLLARMDEPVSDPVFVDLADRVTAAWELVETDDATLEVDLAGVQVAADPDRLQHLLENLFRNSVEHGSPSSRTESDDITERRSVGSQNASRSDDSVEHGSTDTQPGPDETVDGGTSVLTVNVGLTDDADGFYVADDDGGIPPDERSLVFDSGYSLRPGNTGYGLTIVDHVAEAHGWDVMLTDSAAGGARFEFTGAELRFPDS